MNQKFKKDLLPVKKTNNGDGMVTWKASNSGTPRSDHLNKNPTRPDMHPLYGAPLDFTLGRFNCRGEFVIPKGR